jgi:two-component system C4-dicarboxylate transport response regulator DctD
MLDAARRYRRGVPVLSPAHLQALQRQDWPGNVRELRNAADRYVLGLPSALPGVASASAIVASSASLANRVSAFERSVIDAALRYSGGNVATACAALGRPKQTLYHKMHKHGLVPEDYR